jgi:hypothetical protein
MTLGKPDGKSDGNGGYGFNRALTPFDPGRPGQNDTGAASSRPVFPPEKKTLVGMPAAVPLTTPVPPAPAEVAKSTSTSAMAAISSPTPVLRASELFSGLVNARAQIARLCDIDNGVEFDEVLRELVVGRIDGDAFMRELNYWLSKRVVRVKFVPNLPPEDGWVVDQVLDEKILDSEGKPVMRNNSPIYKLLEPGLIEVTVKKAGAPRKIHIRHVMAHNLIK